MLVVLRVCAQQDARKRTASACLAAAHLNDDLAVLVEHVICGLARVECFVDRVVQVLDVHSGAPYH